MGDFPYLERCTRAYKEKAEKDGTWISYLKAHGLANACATRDPTKDRHRLVYDIEDSWYNGNHPLTFRSHQKLIAQHKQLLWEYREKTKEGIRALVPMQRAISMRDMFSVANMNSTIEFSVKAISMSKTCSDRFIELSRKFIDSSVKLLRTYGASAPCSFAVVGLGSVVRGEATPYSDVEYAFIVESQPDHEYFKRLAVDSYFRIGNMGETPLKSFDIRDIDVKDEHGRSTLSSTTTGYRINGISANAGNIPTGGTGGGEGLTFTVEGFMRAYENALLAPVANLRGDLSDLLSSLVLIYSHGQGVGIYDRAVQARSTFKLGEGSCYYRTLIAAKRLNTLLAGATAHDFIPTFQLNQRLSSHDGNVKVKSDIFQYPTLLASNLKISLKLPTTYPWETYTYLQEAGSLSERNCRYLTIALALSIYIRTSAYLFLGTQSELVSVYTSTTKEPTDRYYVPQNLFFTLGYLLVPIKKTAKAVAKSRSRFFADFEKVGMIGIMKSLVLDFVVFETDYLLKAEILVFVQNSQLALNCIYDIVGRRAVEDYDQMSEIIIQKYGNADVTRYLSFCGTLLFNCDKWELALIYFNRTARVTQRDAEKTLPEHFPDQCSDGAASYSSIGTVHAGPDNYKLALKYLLKALDLGEQFLHDGLSRTLTAEGYFGVSQIYYRRGNYTEALRYCNMYLDLLHAVHGEELNANNHSVYEHIGNVCLAIGLYKNAFEYYNLSLTLKKIKYGECTSCLEISAGYHHIAEALFELRNYKDSLEYNIKSLNMEKAIHGEHAVHSGIAARYLSIAVVCCEMANYQMALNYYNKCIEMINSLHGDKANHLLFAKTYNSMGVLFLKWGKHKMALRYYMKSLDMKVATHGDGKDHANIATSLGNVGLVHNELGTMGKAVEFCLASLNMRKAIQLSHSGDDGHLAIVNCYNIGTSLCEIGEFHVAVESHKMCLKIMERMFGKDAVHPSMATSCYNIGQVYGFMGRYVEALQYHLKALDTRHKTFESEANHPDIARSYAALGLIFFAIGQPRKSLHYNHKASAMMSAVHGSQRANHDYCSCVRYIGTAYYSIKDYNKSLLYFMRAVEILYTLLEVHSKG